MKIQIQALNFSLSRSQSRYLERRIDFALADYLDDVERVEVWLSSNCISDGNVQKRCRLNVDLVTGARLVIDSSDLDLRVAIHRAADQASWEVPRGIIRHMRRPNPAALGQRDKRDRILLEMPTPRRQAQYQAA